MSNLKQLSGAIRFALFAGAASMLAAPAFAQDADQDDSKVVTTDRIQVTGSRIATANVEGSLPVTVITRAEMDASGDVSVSEFLRSTTFNSFGSVKPQSGSSAQSVATVNLRGLGSARTLVLIDGRRAPVSPTLGQGQDLNSIPLAAVERIEILRDGASAVYGSDAIGGVVNIITRRDFSGVEARYGFGRPSREGGDTEEGSLIFGASGDRGSLMGGMSYNSRDIVFARDRSWSAGGASSYGNNYYSAIQISGPPGSTNAADYIRGGFLGGVQNFAPGGAGCDDDPGLFVSGSFCAYDFTFVSADEAEVDTSSLFMRGQYEINDNWSTFLLGSVTRTESFGRYAPVPGQYFIPGGSANNYVGAAPVFLRHRATASGPRDQYIDGQTYNVMWGFNGQVSDTVNVEFGVRRVESSFHDYGYNYLVVSLFEAAAANGSYDILNPSLNPSSVLNSIEATIFRDASTQYDEAFASAQFDLFEMGGGTTALVVGAEARSEDYADIYDSLSSAGVIAGSAGNSAAGGRNSRAFFGEFLMPITDTFETRIAARYDDYSDFGNATSPSISFRWQPLDNLTLRASYGEGFRAPTLDILTQQPAFSADFTSDPGTCYANTGFSNCTSNVTLVGSTQADVYVLANPNLGAEESDGWNIGAAYDPTDWLGITLDIHNTKLTNSVTGIGLTGTGGMEDCLGPNPQQPCPAGVTNLSPSLVPPVASAGLGIARGPADPLCFNPGTTTPCQGPIVYAQRGFINRGTIETRGFDLGVNSKFDFGNWGSLRTQLTYSFTDSYKLDGVEIIGSTGAPDYRASVNNTWAVNDFTFGWNVSLIDETPLLDGSPGRTWVIHDLQASWAAPWNGNIILGVTNLTDNEPVIDFNQGRAFDTGLYDAYGRVPYVRYTQTW